MSVSQLCAASEDDNALWTNMPRQEQPAPGGLKPVMSAFRMDPRCRVLCHSQPPSHAQPRRRLSSRRCHRRSWRK